MKVTCQNSECGFTFSVPDEKIPDRPIRVACPKCKQPNSVQKANVADYNKIMAEVDRKLATLRGELSGQMGGGVPSAAAGGTTSSFSNAPEVSGIKKALVCDDDKMVREMIKDSVASLGYEVEEAPTLKESLAALEKPNVEYNLILIDKVFPDDPEGGYQILSKIATLSIDVRRDIFVVFISGEMKSCDASSAFLMGANAIINKDDLSKLKPILNEEIGNYERLYQAFNRCLHMAKGLRL